MSQILHRSLPIEVRGIDEESRTAEFVASTEGAVPTWRGPEVLRMAGAKLDRYRSNGVVLDAHRMESALDVIGRATVRREGRQLISRVEFDDDGPEGRATKIWNKVRKGFLRAVSVGYSIDPDQVRVLKPGESDGRGDNRVDGPAVVVNGWELHEISVVPVPADRDALRRDFYAALGRSLESTPEPQGGHMTDPTPASEPASEAAPVLNLEAERAKREAETSKARTAAREARHAEIRGFTPQDLLPFLGELFLADPDVTVESARRALLEERKRSAAPVGTPEPSVAAPASSTNQPAAEPALDARTLTQLLSGR